MNAEDRRLIRDTLTGESAAFGELVRRYQDRLFNAVLRIVGKPEDAADVVQDAFVNAYLSLRSFHGDAEFFTWLYRIAFNTAISWKRRQKTTLSLDADHGGTSIAEPADESRNIRPGEAMERREESVRIEAALARLSDVHRQVLVLKDLEGLKYDVIAQILEVPIGTVRSRLHRARLEMHDLLVEQESREGEGSSLPERC